jgi:hypothetical protein
MTEKTTGRYASGFGLAFVAASLVNALLVIAKDLNPALKEAMKRAATHHWIAHAIIVIAVFGVLGLVLSRVRLGESFGTGQLSWLVPIAAIASGGIIVVFYILRLNG